MSSGVISSRSDYAVGQTLDTSFNLSTSPFTDESQIAFCNAYSDKKSKSNIDNQGKCEMYCTLVQKEKDRAKALGVDGSLDMTYGPVSGDANVKLAMNNIQGSLQLTMVVRAKQDGRIIKNELTQLIKLELRKAVTDKLEAGNYTIDDFKKEYGSYLIFGFDYGGEINFTSTYSTNSSDDKFAVGGGLTLKYSEMGFNIKGSVQGNYESNDVNKSTNIETKYSISPSFNDEEKLISGTDGIIQLLTKISNPSSNADADNAGQTSAKLYAKMQKLLGGATLDPVKAIIYPIEKIGVISDAFTNIKPAKEIKFFKAMNPLYQTLKEIYQGVAAIDKNYDINDYYTKDTVDLYLKALNINISKMEIIQGTELNNFVDAWYNYTVDNSIDDEMKEAEKREVEKEFYKIDRNILESQFNEELFNPYNEMMKQSESERANDKKQTFDANDKCEISIRGYNGKYVKGNVALKKLNCNSNELTQEEIITSYPQVDDKIALYTADYGIVTVYGTKVKVIRPTTSSSNASKDQKFKVVACNNGRYALQSYANNKYLSAKNNNELVCDRTFITALEQFQINVISNLD